MKRDENFRNLAEIYDLANLGIDYKIIEFEYSFDVLPFLLHFPKL